MRMLIKLAIFCILMTISISIFAQSVDNDLPNAISSILDFLPIKYQKIFTIIMTSLFILEQVLASTQKIKANSTFQLIASWVNKIYNVVKTKK